MTVFAATAARRPALRTPPQGFVGRVSRMPRDSVAEGMRLEYFDLLLLFPSITN